MKTAPRIILLRSGLIALLIAAGLAALFSHRTDTPRVAVARPGETPAPHEPTPASPSKPGTATAEPEALPPSPDVLWGQRSPVPACAAFQEWTERYAAAPGNASLPAEGLKLAAARRAALKEMIRRDPRAALAAAVPESVRRTLPAEVKAQLEDRMDARGDLEFVAATPSPGVEPLGPATRASARIADRQLEVFSYGRREWQISQRDLPLHGIVIDGQMALSEWPARVLEPLEAAEARKSLTNEPKCVASGLTTAATGTEVALNTGGHVDFFCRPAHAAMTLRAAVTAENALPPGFARRLTAADTAASDGTGSTVPNNYVQATEAWTTGAKRVAVVRVSFAGTAYVNFTPATCADLLTGVSDAWLAWSYGKASIAPVGPAGSFITPVLDLPKIAYAYKDTTQDMDSIWLAALDWAVTQGRTEDTFDIILVLMGDAPIRDRNTGDEVWWGGLGKVGAGATIVRSTSVGNAIGTTLHEFGHNLGLRHASNVFDSPRPGPSANGTYDEYGDEYGDRYDRMGRGGQDYNVHSKHYLHWLSDDELPLAAGDGRFVIREHDLEERGGLRGLQVPLPMSNDYILPWNLTVEYRLYDLGVPAVRDGAQIRLVPPYGAKSWLLDCTPETENNEADGNQDGNLDSPLPEGRTLSYTHNGGTVHITNINADFFSGQLTVQVNHGTPPGNVAPTGSITASQAIIAQNQKFYLTANVSDANGDELACYWMVPGTGYLPNRATVAVSFPGVSTYTVKCMVSDMHGGVTTLTKQITTTVNSPPVISALADQNVDEDSTLGPLFFTVSDATTPAASISVSAASGNVNILPAAGITITNLSNVLPGMRSITLTPAANRYGTVNISVTANDGGLTATESFALTVRPVTPGSTLVATSAAWNYWDSVGAPARGWSEQGFDDSAWKSGQGGFIHGQGALPPAGWTLLSTSVSRVTTCYRTTFQAPLLPAGSLMMRMLCDDGAVVYLNGTEVWRYNMPGGAIPYTARASLSMEGANETTWITVPLSKSALVFGSNTLAVEVHDFGGTRGGGDVTFAATLTNVSAPAVSTFADQTSEEDKTFGPLNFTAADSEGAALPLTFTAVCSDPSLIMNNSIAVQGSNGNYQLWLKPKPNAFGSALITVKVSDGSSETWRTFTHTVTPVNDPPAIQPTEDVVTPMNHAPPSVLLEISDVDNAPASLTVTAHSSNQAVISDAGLAVLPGDSPATRWLHLTPNIQSIGKLEITVTVSDGAANVSTSFTFRVSPTLSVTAGRIELTSSGDEWRYWAQPLPLDSRGAPINWVVPGLDETAWLKGNSQLGYGGDGEITAVPSTPFRIATYFRRHFQITNPSSVTLLKLRLLRDDGAVVYLNGTKVHTSNLPASVTATTPALSDVSGAAEDAWEEVDVAASRLVAGDNVLAVEVHQSSMPVLGNAGDLSFDLELQGIPAAAAKEDILIPPAGTWSYWDWSYYPDASWTSPGYFEDNKWKTGFARFGYGTAGQSTNLSGGSAAQRNPSILFRKAFDVADPALYRAVHLFVQRDDGIAVHLNGTRVLANNIPPAATVGDFALSEIPGNNHLTWHHFLFTPDNLLAGRNLIAVSVHQASVSGADLTFDLQLTGELTSALPVLHLHRESSEVELSWPAAFNDWIPRASTDLQNWSPLAQPTLRAGGWLYLLTPGDLPRHFFRLQKPQQ